MNALLIDNPMETVNALLKLHIGDEGRLLYLRNSLKKGKVIFNSDKLFLQRMQAILDQRSKKISSIQIKPTLKQATQKKIFEYNKNDPAFIDKPYEIVPPSKEQKNKNVFQHYKQIPDLEKILFDISNSIIELKESQYKILTNLEELKNNYKKYLMYDQTSTNFNIDKLDEQSQSDEFQNNSIESNKENNAFSNYSKRKKTLKNSDILAWLTSGLFIVWFANYLKIIDINPYEHLFLITSIGLAIYLGLHRLRRK